MMIRAKVPAAAVDYEAEIEAAELRTAAAAEEMEQHDLLPDVQAAKRAKTDKAVLTAAQKALLAENNSLGATHRALRIEGANWATSQLAADAALTAHSNSVATRAFVPLKLPFHDANWCGPNATKPSKSVTAAVKINTAVWNSYQKIRHVVVGAKTAATPEAVQELIEEADVMLGEGMDACIHEEKMLCIGVNNGFDVLSNYENPEYLEGPEDVKKLQHAIAVTNQKAKSALAIRAPNRQSSGRGGRGGGGSYSGGRSSYRPPQEGRGGGRGAFRPASGPPAPAAGRVICFICSLPGHYASACPSKQ